MSTPRLISPLLDNFVMGEPIFERNGVRILPAMAQDNESKYIVKIISIPANQSQVDALLITGAYKDADAVNGYFAELADATVKEADLLTQLSSAGGFDGYENVQVVPMDDGNGYDVYLLAPYRPTWDRIILQKAVTQLDGYNLALDVCAALSVARRNGYLYTNLKPESISVTASGSYHICDLGLAAIDYLQYSSLQTAYFSAYTAPEVADAYSSLNGTMDVYALGMMLYEIFNGGLPFDTSRAAATEYPPPAYADEEFAQIILKAIHPDPVERWQDPTEMGQSIVSVMQRKGVSDAPIVPVVQPLEEEPQPEADDNAVVADISDIESIAASEDTTEQQDEPVTEAEPETEVPPVETVNEVMEEAAEPVEPITIPDASEESLPDESAEQAPAVDDSQSCEDNGVDEVPAAEEELDAEEDLDDILVEADKLIADLQIDPSEMSAEIEYGQLEISEPAAESDAADAEEPAATSSDDTDYEKAHSSLEKPRRRKAILVCSIVLFALLLIGGLFFYRHVYLQDVDILSVTGAADRISVAVVTDIDSDKLTVVCIDGNGNTVEVPLENYKATITGLAAQSNYTVTLKIKGFHKLYGQTEYTYATPEKTEIKDLTILNGTSEGTAEVSFQVVGPNEGNWVVTFMAEGEADHTATAIDGKATVTGLTLDKVYTVSLSNSADLYYDDTGVKQTFTPSAVIKAVNPYVSSCSNGKLTVNWSSPESNTAVTWIVRCYNGNGFEEMVTTDQLTVTFDVPDSSKAYTVEISAMGQASKDILQVTENAITLSDFTVNTALPGRITLNWTANADIPEGGYQISYTVDGVQVAETVNTADNSFTILNAVPDALHVFSFAGANGESILCEPVAVTATGENPFSAFGIKAGNMRFNLCVRPSKTNWAYKDVAASSFTTEFSVGQKAGVAARILSKYYTSTEVVATVYVFRNASGSITHVCSTEEKWGNMWVNGYGTFDVPSLPELPGSYSLDMYIDGGLVYQTDIAIK